MQSPSAKIGLKEERNKQYQTSKKYLRTDLVFVATLQNVVVYMKIFSLKYNNRVFHCFQFQQFPFSYYSGTSIEVNIGTAEKIKAARKDKIQSFKND